MARRLAAVGYFVVLPNLYYRLTRDFWLTERTEERMAHMFSLMATLDAATTLCDTDAMLALRRRQPRGRRRPHRRGRLLHERAVRDVGGGGAVRSGSRCIASIHGANMVTDKPDSPHRMPPKIRCESYFACAEIDKWAPPADVEKLQAALQEAGTPHRLEWYPGVEHGFVFPLRAACLRPGRGGAALGAPVQPCSSARCARRPDGPSLERLGQRRRRPPLSERARRFLAERIGVAVPATSASREAALQAVGAGRLPAATAFETDPAIRLDHAFGQSMPDWIALRSGRIGRVADGVALPASHAEAVAALDEAKRLGALVIPYGGGTSVVGHLRVPEGDRPVVNISLERLAALQAIDVQDLTARFGAGAPGPGDRGGAGGARHDARPLPAVVRALDRGRLGRDPIVRPAIAALRPDRAAVPRAAGWRRRAASSRSAACRRRAPGPTCARRCSAAKAGSAS